MPAASLFDMAKRQIIRNIDSEHTSAVLHSVPADVLSVLTDVGELPYSFLRPVLLKVENPEQLVHALSSA